MPDDVRGGGPGVKVAGAALAEDLAAALMDVRVEQSLHLPARFTLRLVDPRFEIFDKATFEVGKEIEVSFKVDNVEAVIGTGEITAVAIEPGPAGGRHELVVTAYDLGHRLARGSQVRTYVDQKDSDIAGTVAKEHGLTPKAKGTTQKHPYMIQARNDYDFLRERAHAMGYTWYVSKKQLHFEPLGATGTPPELEWGSTLRKFKARLSAAEAITEAEVRGWDPATQKPIKATAKPKNDTKELGTDAKAATDTAKAAKKLKGRRFGVGAPVLDAGEATALATAVVERAVGEEMTVKGEAIGNPKMKAGGEIKIKGVGQRLSGKYLLTWVEHVWGSGQPYVTRFESAGRQARTLVDLLGSNGRRPSQLSGLAIGVVTSVADPEGSSRVKVKFPALSDEDESWWARILMPGAAKNRGFIIYPEVGDEVLVGFEHGDLRRPVVLGGLWSKKNTVPLANKDSNKKLLKDGKVLAREWHSRLGHKITMNDGEKPAEKWVTIELSDKKTWLKLIEDKVDFATPSDTAFAIDKKWDVAVKDNITIDGKKQITIKAGTKLVLQAPQIEIKGQTSILIDGGKVDVKAKGMMTVQAGGITTIKGSLVKIN